MCTPSCCSNTRHETFNFLLVLFTDRPCDALFIAFPLVSVVLQSVHTAHEAVLVTVENVARLAAKETTIDQDATSAIRAAEPLGRFVGLDIYFDRGHLAIAEFKQAWTSTESLSRFSNYWQLPFYRSMAFTSPLPLSNTSTYCFRPNDCTCG